MTIQLTANTSGNLMGILDPNFLSDSQNAFSALFVNNSSTYNGTGTGNAYANLLNVTTPWNVANGTVTGYRLVSAACVLASKVSLQNRAGKFGMAVAPIPQFAGTTTGNAFSNVYMPITIGNFSNIMDLDNYAEAAVDSSVPNLRGVWFPANGTLDYEYSLINDVALSLTTGVVQQTCFVFYATGLGASTVINLELYFNYELIPTIGQSSQSSTKSYISTEDPIQSKYRLLSDTTNVCHPLASAFITSEGLRPSSNGVFSMSQPYSRKKVGSFANEIARVDSIQQYLS
jgi:hypothetical protein